MISGRAWLLCALLTQFVLGESSAQDSPVKIYAVEGDDVILPCYLDLDYSNVFPTVDWSKKGLKRNVFLYRAGCETFEMKHPAYEYRSSLIMMELKNRNISLRISNVRINDTGTFSCMMIYVKENVKKTKTVELVVVPKPQIRMTEEENRSLAVECEAKCCTPECQMMFVDHQGNRISTTFPERDLDSSGCYHLKARATMADRFDRITCQVLLPEKSGIRSESAIQIPATCQARYKPDQGVNNLAASTSCTNQLVIAVIASILFTLVLSGLVILWKHFCKSDVRTKVPLYKVSSAALLGNDSPDSKKQRAEEQLQRNVDELEARLGEREARLAECEARLVECEARLVECKASLREREDTIQKLKAQLQSQTTMDRSPTINNMAPYLPKRSDTTSSTVPAGPHPELSAEPNSGNHIPIPAASTMNSHPQPTTVSHNRDSKKQLQLPAPFRSQYRRHNSYPGSFSCSAARPSDQKPLMPPSDSGAPPPPSSRLRSYSIRSQNHYAALSRLDEES